MKRVLTALGVLVILAACTGPTPDAEPGPITQDPTVTLKNVEFTPAVVTVEEGAVVTWVWDDGTTPHNVVFDDFESDIIESGTYNHTFDESGTYGYVCDLHPRMQGTVFVVAPEETGA